jgi:DNA-binding CsgD family transcriptional regulator
MKRARRRAPDGIEPLLGYRMWNYTLRRGAIQLHALGCRGEEWSGRCGWAEGGSTWVTASCSRRRHRRSTVPAENCTCGFYAMRTIERLLEEAPLPILFLIGGAPVDPDVDEDMVLGRVDLAGKIVAHEHGFRAEKARVAELFPFEGSEPKIMRLASRLGVPMGPSVRWAPAGPETSSSEPLDDHLRLTNHEVEVLRLVARGFGEKKIARFLCLERGTVRAHMGSIVEKMRANSRLDMVLFRRPAILWGLAEVHDQAFEQVRPSGNPPSWGGFSLN